MASSKVKNGNLITIPLAEVKADDVIVINDFVGVAIIDTDYWGDVVVAIAGVFDLKVHGHDGSEGAAVEFGHKIYVDPATKTLSRDESKTFFGLSLGSVQAGEEATVPIKF
jgi:predicted RecA/RadA family phage recombinase